MSSSGCATVWTVLEVTGADWQQGEVSRTRPLGPEQRELRVSGEYVPPGPPVFVEPQPGIVVVQPEVVTGRPFPQGALKLKCNEVARFTREEVTTTRFRYDGVWKALTAFMFVSEAALSTFLIWASFQRNDGKLDGAPLGIGIGLGLDAIGTAVLFWHPPEARTKSHEQDGQWKSKSNECAPQLAVATSTGPFAVEKNGDVPGLGEWMLQHVVDTEETWLDLQLGQTIVPWRPEVLEKCEWSRLANSPAPFCRWASGFNRESSVTIPLQ